ncbi:CCA tRNA nucleotidyltransferase [Robertmurraya yapensis]|uniref:CCA-adding enzyme n=2 Tax=Bacillaceae TaxID=186817 RepID=A0A431W4V0_9BACI|nr:CCA tRNA nucleotidyltransferase [Bacillus yapensis]RTR30459.1 CCA tRNA nucleotidyltransferase [Bacillus yapensis]TKS95278.1 CCA tRNA nucleotidyltransferase [Bacillus yapensis]
MKYPFEKALPILEEIEKAGYEAYFVGGSVRDLLLNREIGDVDIATSATPEEIKGIFSKTVDVGIAHGTVVVLYQGESYEVTTFRSESEYDDFRRPNDVTFIRSLEEDLRRRDFTMNAMAMNKDGEIIDPFDGRAALQNKVIKTVGDASERFHEDALRMMRAVRFVSQLSFAIDSETFQALKEHGKLLSFIAVERITTEFEKLLMGQDYQQAIRLLIETGMYQYLPGLTSYKEELHAFQQLQLDRSFTIEEHWVILLYHFNLPPTEVESFMRGWKQPVKKIRSVQKGLSCLYKRMNSGWGIEELYRAQIELAVSTEKLFNVLMKKDKDYGIKQLEEQWQALPIKERSELAVTGQDLMAWYEQKGGPWIEERLRQIEIAVIKREIRNGKESIREWLFECNQP